MQAVCESETSPEVARVAGRLRAEYVVAVSGTLRARRDPNLKLPTGAVELLVEQVST